MKAKLVLFLLATVALLSPQPLRAQAPRPVAVADFVDESLDGRFIRARRLSGELQRLLAQQADGRLRVIAGDEVWAALQVRSYTPDDLVYPSKAAEVAAAVGAEWIVTGRWTRLRLIHLPEPRTPPDLRHGSQDGWAYATLQVRVLETSTRRVLLEQAYSTNVFGLATPFLLQIAARKVLEDAAAGIARL